MHGSGGAGPPAAEMDRHIQLHGPPPALREEHRQTGAPLLLTQLLVVPLRHGLSALLAGSAGFRLPAH